MDPEQKPDNKPQEQTPAERDLQEFFGLDAQQARTEQWRQDVLSNLSAQIKKYLEVDEIPLNNSQLQTFCALLTGAAQALVTQCLFRNSTPDTPYVVKVGNVMVLNIFECAQGSDADPAAIELKLNYASLISTYLGQYQGDTPGIKPAFETTNATFRKIAEFISFMDTFPDGDGIFQDLSSKAEYSIRGLLKHPQLVSDLAAEYRHSIIYYELESLSPNEAYEQIFQKITEDSTLELIADIWLDEGIETPLNWSESHALTRDYTRDYSQLYKTALKENTLDKPEVRKNIALRACYHYGYLDNDSGSVSVSLALKEISDRRNKAEENKAGYLKTPGQTAMVNFESERSAKYEYLITAIEQFRKSLEQYFEH